MFNPKEYLESNKILSHAPEQDAAIRHKAKEQELEKAKIEVQRLGYELYLNSPSGIKLTEILKENFVNATYFSPKEQNCELQALYWEGFKNGLMFVHNEGLVHKKRIAGVNG